LEPQVAPVFAIVTDDFDGDSLVDLLLCGNFSGLKHEVARQDANRGVVMKGDGHVTSCIACRGNWNIYSR